jgi:hypothetical protein
MNIYHKILEVVHVGIRVQKRGDSITYRLKYGELEKQFRCKVSCITCSLKLPHQVNLSKLKGDRALLV